MVNSIGIISLVKTNLVFIVTILVIVSASCSKTTPAGFWKDYKNQYIVKHISDQGPYGGHRAIYWKSDSMHLFTFKDIVEYATNNGWELTDTSSFTKEETAKWMYLGKPVFPLTGSGFTTTEINNSQTSKFPRWFNGPINVIKFRTGWLSFEPGADNATEENGFIILNSDRTEMSVYQLWGE